MSRSLRLKAAIVGLLMSAGGASAEGCYRLEYDPVMRERPNWTLTEASDWTLIWSRNGERTVLDTGSAGSGIATRVAVSPDGSLHEYRMVDDKLVFDMAVYEPGCQ